LVVLCNPQQNSVIFAGCWSKPKLEKPCGKTKSEK
jgi:hypothetical protein